jgi:hypothetical protein
MRRSRELMGAKLYGWDVLRTRRLRGQLKLSRAQRLEGIGVEGDSVVLFRFQAHDLGRDVFQRPQQFASALGQKHCVRSGHLHVNLPCLEAVRITGSRSCDDAVLQSQAAGGGKGL